MQSVLILGGGLAGLAAAVALAPRGFRVVLAEARDRLGGRAGSFFDRDSGQWIDHCQHVSMGCCTNFAHFCRTVGVSQFLQPQKCLYFTTPDRRVSRLAADNWPAPFHLARSFLSAHYLTPLEKLQIAYGLICLQRSAADTDPPFRDWLRQHGQSQRTIDRFWGLVLVSALNETPEWIGLKYARKVFVDGFLRHRRGFELELPTVPLSRFYGKELKEWMARHQVEIRTNRRVKEIRANDNNIVGAALQTGEVDAADWYLSALPFDRLLDALPNELIENHAYFHQLRNLETSPITSVHLWLDRSITELPHAVLLDGVGQWLFDRGESAPGEHYYQVVVSAARVFQGCRKERIQGRIFDELRQVFPQCKRANVLRARVVTARAATFSAVPGVDRWRPPQASPLNNLLVAGDWTATGWPATMEGAVRSGYLAAEALLQKIGNSEKLLQPEIWESR